MKYKNKLYKNIEASKFDINNFNIENAYENIISILINNSINNILEKNKK